MSDGNFIAFSPKEVFELGQLVVRLKRSLHMHKERIQKLLDERTELEEEVSRLRMELELERTTKAVV